NCACRRAGPQNLEELQSSRQLAQAFRQVGSASFLQRQSWLVLTRGSVPGVTLTAACQFRNQIISSAMLAFVSNPAHAGALSHVRSPDGYTRGRRDWLARAERQVIAPAYSSRVMQGAGPSVPERAGAHLSS